LRPTLKSLLKRYSFYLGGDQPVFAWVERLRSVAGAFIRLLLVVIAAKFLGEFSGVDEWLMASLGASALLVFALPQSPMSQSWAVITGNTLPALVGIATFHFIDQSC
jgi:CBS domain-containing membrane protein